MHLEEIKKRVEEDIIKFSKEVNRLEECKKKLGNLVQPQTADLYKGIEDYFTMNVDKQETGVIANVEVKEGFYLNYGQRQIIKDYIKRVYEVDKVVFKNQFELSGSYY